MNFLTALLSITLISRSSHNLYLSPKIKFKKMQYLKKLQQERTIFALMKILFINCSLQTTTIYRRTSINKTLHCKRVWEIKSGYIKRFFFILQKQILTYVYMCTYLASVKCQEIMLQLNERIAFFQKGGMKTTFCKNKKKELKKKKKLFSDIAHC